MVGNTCLCCFWEFKWTSVGFYLHACLGNFCHVNACNSIPKLYLMFNRKLIFMKMLVQVLLLAFCFVIYWTSSGDSPKLMLSVFIVVMVKRHMYVPLRDVCAPLRNRFCLCDPQHRNNLLNSLRYLPVNQKRGKSSFSYRA